MTAEPLATVFREDARVPGADEGAVRIEHRRAAAREEALAFAVEIRAGDFFRTTDDDVVSAFERRDSTCRDSRRDSSGLRADR
jgi:hypothetical protein